MIYPGVPDWIRDYLPPPGWTNVFALVPSNNRLYGTETLFGDWGGQTLLLAKDGAPTPVIRALRDKGESQPWRHADRKLGDAGGWRTNESLADAAAAISGGKLYGSATANLLLDDPRWSRKLPGVCTPGPLRDYLKRVLTWVLESMPYVSRIACLGEEAWSLTSEVLGRPDLSKDFSRYRGSHEPMTGTCAGKQLSAFALFHPAARVSNEAKRECWTAMLESSVPAVIHNRPSAQRTSEEEAVMPESESPSSKTAGQFVWYDTSPRTDAKHSSPVGIRKEMLAALRKAGEAGVLTQGFTHLSWQDGFRKDKLSTAIQLLADETGIAMQYQARQAGTSGAFRWRIRP